MYVLNGHVFITHSSSTLLTTYHSPCLIITRIAPTPFYRPLTLVRFHRELYVRWYSCDVPLAKLRTDFANLRSYEFYDQGKQEGRRRRRCGWGIWHIFCIKEHFFINSRGRPGLKPEQGELTQLSPLTLTTAYDYDKVANCELRVRRITKTVVQNPKQLLLLKVEAVRGFVLE